jgi:hypothetical protein
MIPMPPSLQALAKCEPWPVVCVRSWRVPDFGLISIVIRAPIVQPLGKFRITLCFITK